MKPSEFGGQDLRPEDKGVFPESTGHKPTAAEELRKLYQQANEEDGRPWPPRNG